LGIVQLLTVPKKTLAAGTLLSSLPPHLKHDQSAKAVRDKHQWAQRFILIDLADIRHPPKADRTFLVRFKALSNRSATVGTLCCIISLPNHCDWYPYRMMRAFGATAGSILSSSSQLTHRGLSLVPAFAHQLSSGWAPRPWIATMLGELA
jgi:hypothetical protein